MRLCSFVAAAALLSNSLAAHADVLYSFVGQADRVPGTTFTIDSPDFLTDSTTLVPVTTGTDLFLYQGPNSPLFDFGQITAVQFESFETYIITDRSEPPFVFGAFPLRADGVYVIGGIGTLTITGSPTASSITPEPSSFALLGTGLLGFAGVVRKRFAQ